MLTYHPQLAYCSFGYLFNKFIKDRYRGWWMNYNYITAAAWDVGLALMSILIFFAIQLPTGKVMTDWWGTTVITTTADQMQTAVRKTVADGEIFGPSTWKW